MSRVSYDPRAIAINGRRQLLISGAIHYPRSTPAMWPQLLKESAAAGLNTIETYLFWNLHEPRRGVLDFTGRLDLMRFCQLAQEHGLHVILRIGPYICAETNYGGFPAWLREVPGIQMRTWNEPFLREMGRWVRQATNLLRPLFAPNGGPIIAAQIENEYALVGASYGEDGERYKQWAADLGQSLNLGVPWIMCFGGAPGAVETINGFYGHTQLNRHWEAHPEQPALWTENWTGWYDTWGTPHHKRSVSDLLYATARFFAAGGTGVNYYMWHGGTNFGREAMYLQTTSYDYDAPLDEFGLPTTKSQALSRLHQVLHAQAGTLLAHERPTPMALGPFQTAYTYGPLAFLCNDDPAAAATVTFGDRPYALAPQSVQIINDGSPRFDTAAPCAADEVRRMMRPVTDEPFAFAWREEPLPTDRPDCATVPQPVEQLALTHDETDYCWYTTRVTAPEGAAPLTLTLTGVADYVYLYVNGQPAGVSAEPLAEHRGPLAAFQQSFTLPPLPAGSHELSILCCAVGLIKGDWMLGMANMAQERKGLWGDVLLNGQPLPGPWELRPGLAGERSRLYRGTVSGWTEAPDGAARPLRWLRTSFDRPAGNAPLALDLGSLSKGLVWVNGHCLGRYWTAVGIGPTDPGLKPPVLDDEIGQPTQRYYHVPADWLKSEGNMLVLFEEAGGDPEGIRLCRWIEA